MESDVVQWEESLGTPRQFKILGPRVCVQLLPEKSTYGLLEIPDTAIKSVYRRGVVRAVGRYVSDENEVRPASDSIKVGDECVVVRFHANVHTNEQVQNVLGKDMIIVEPKDILLVCDPSDQVEFT